MSPFWRQVTSAPVAPMVRLREKEHEVICAGVCDAAYAGSIKKTRPAIITGADAHLLNRFPI